MPLPRPPPTPPTPDDDHDATNAPTEGTEVHVYAPDALSPLSASFATRTQYASLGSMSPPKASPRAPLSATLSPNSSLSPYSPMFSENSDSVSVAASDGSRNPFNFQTQAYAPGRPAQIKSVSSSVSLFHERKANIKAGYRTPSRP